MKKWIALTVMTLFFLISTNAQMKVAQYSVGNYGTDQYENFGFWTEKGKPTHIDYSYGKDGREVKLHYLGKDKLNGKPGFKVRFPNSYTLWVIPDGDRLKISDSTGKYRKTFSWQYEGPVDGIGTYCDVCAGDEHEAMKLIQSCYLK